MPKGPSPESLVEQLGSFIDFERPKTLQVLDRSTLQLAGQCPYLCACHLAGKLNISQCAHVGEQVHQAFGRVTRQWVESNGDMHAGQIKDQLINELHASRPDLQPEVIQSAVASAWAWACYLKNVRPVNVLAFDGGDDLNKSGQFACEFPDLGVTATSEIDFLHSGPSPKLLHEVDYKSGWKKHSPTSVAADFQFQKHALLVFANFPDVDGLEVSVWNSRTNRLTYPVLFDREKHLPQFTARVRMCIQHYMTDVLPHDIDDPANLPPAWPTSEKCCQCDAAYLCPVAGQENIDVGTDPVAAMRKLVVLEEAAGKLSKALAAHVDKHGDIVDGQKRFGRDKPRTEKKSPATLYELKSKAEEANGSE